MYFLNYDIGGTNIRGRISTFENGTPRMISRINTTYTELTAHPTEKHPLDTIHRLIEAFEKDGYDASNIVHGAFAVSGRVDRAQRSAVVIANGTRIDAAYAESILRRYGCTAKADLLNDFEAGAFGVSGVREVDRAIIRGAARPAEIEENSKRIVICGPGTGLGVACLILDVYHAGQHFVLTSESGHSTFGAETDDFKKFIHDVFGGRASYESVVSGPGLVRLHRWVSQKTKTPIDYVASPEEICRRARNQEEAALKAVEMFAYALGQFCGNQALAFNCDRAIYLWGGVVSGLPDSILLEPFSRAFENRLKYANLVAEVPVYRITDSDMTHRGCVIFSSIVIR